MVQSNVGKIFRIDLATQEVTEIVVPGATFVAGDGLLNVMVNQGAVNALVQNGGMIRADGGQVLLTAQAAGPLTLRRSSFHLPADSPCPWVPS